MDKTSLASRTDLLSALWAYAPDGAAETPGDEDDGGLTALVASLAVEHSGTTIDTPVAWGDDLLVRFTPRAAPNEAPNEEDPR